MTNAIQAIVTIQDNHATTTSKNIADVFGKRHDHVLRAIENLLQDLPEEHRPNFGEMLIEVEIGNGAKVQHKAYQITRDGFTLLAMSFTGKRALAFKLAYIDAFNQMEAALSLPAPERKTKQVLIGKLTADQQDAIKALVNSRIDSVPKDKQRGTAMKLWGAINRKFGTKTYKDIDPSEFVNVLSLVSRLPLEGELMPRNETPAIPEGMVLVRKDLLEETNNMIKMINERFTLIEKAENDIQHAFNLLSVITSGHMKQANDAIREARYRLIDPIKHAKSYTGLMLN